jgi:hypothetical protein
VTVRGQGGGWGSNDTNKPLNSTFEQRQSRVKYNNNPEQYIHICICDYCNISLLLLIHKKLRIPTQVQFFMSSTVLVNKVSELGST